MKLQKLKKELENMITKPSNSLFVHSTSIYLNIKFCLYDEVVLEHLLKKKKINKRYLIISLNFFVHTLANLVKDDC